MPGGQRLVAELSVAIAGLRADVKTSDPSVAAIVRDRFAGFTSPGPADWRIEITVPRRSVASSRDVVVKRDGVLARFSVTRYDFAGTVDVGAQTAEVMLTNVADIAEAVSIESFWRILYSLAVLESGGLVVHAASLVRNGKAYLFCGPSGSGKTTLARLSADATLLSDELSIVRLSEGSAVCYGTPFRGDLGLSGEDRVAPLVGIYFLRHGARHAVEMLAPQKALARLLPDVLFFAREADVTARVFGIAADLVEAVPCFELMFRPDPGFWEVIADE